VIPRRARNGRTARNSLTPPRFAAWLLARLLPRDRQHDVILGDMLEEFRRRASHSIPPPGASRASRRAPRASSWYWREALSVLSQTYGYTNMRLFEYLRQDGRFALRSFAKTPGFTAIVVLTLALGIGSSTAIFSAVNGILLKPLPFSEPDRLFWINEVTPDGRPMSVSWPNYQDWRARQQSFETLAISRSSPVTWSGGPETRRLEGRRVSYNFFDTLGVHPALGRGFVPADDRAGAALVVIVTHEFAERSLGGATTAVGRGLTLDGRPFTVVGVLPPGFRYLRDYDLFVAMGAYTGDRSLNERGNHSGYFALGRLRPGVTEEAARREFEDIESSLERQYATVMSGVKVQVQPLASRLVSDVRQTLLVLFGAVGVLLLIACVNVANLLIARGAARQHELAVRSALGGGRGRLATQLLVESTLLSALGGAFGVGLASWLLGLLIAFAPEGTPRIEDVHLDRAALLFAIIAASSCGILFGAFPAVHASKAGGRHVLLRTRGAGASARTNALRRTLQAVEVALALVLLTGAGLMMRTLHRLTTIDPGFRADHLLVMHVSTAGSRWTDSRRPALVEDAIDKIRAMPGVRDAAAASALAIDGSDWNSIFVAEGKPVPARHDQLPSSAFTVITSAYFTTMDTPLVRGRVFTAADREGSALVILVNESLARRIWPGEDPLGKRIKRGWPETPAPWLQVVGVVHDVKFEGVAEATPMQIYMPFPQAPPSDFWILARVLGDPAAAAGPIRSLIHALDRDLSVYDVRPMTAVMAGDIARQRVAELVLGMFAAVALMLAAIGLYGLVAHSVSERTQEIGVRMALGADPADVLRMVIRGGLSMTFVGVIAGVVGAAALAGTLRGLLFGVRPLDPLTFTSVVLLLFVTSTLACLVPAARAVRIPPTTALRAE
jgi:putative ABC transport system permease protein